MATKTATTQETAERSIADTIGSRRNLLTAKEVAGFLSLAPTTVYDMTRTGRIPCVRIGAAKRYDPKTIAEWMRSQTSEA